MHVTETNDVKVYNLSKGKSLPQWMEETERRKKEGRKDYQRQGIQLLQDFSMPVVSDKVKITDDGRYIMATGTYKPRVRCYEVSEMAMKFERCFDSETVDFKMLSDDYSKAVFLHCDRYVEIHAQFGKYYRFRIPHFGRSLDYNPRNCDAYFVGQGNKVSRLNLEQGRFLAPLELETSTKSTKIGGGNVCLVNPYHQLLTVGTTEATVEAWDPRSRARVGLLQCLVETDDHDGPLEITSLAFRDALTLAVGTSQGQVLLYDLRSDRPTLIKDHMYGMPIKKIVFHDHQDMVLSLDAKCVKIWNRSDASAYTTIENSDDAASADLNDFAVYPDSGLILLANEQPTMQVQFLPSLGPAPGWCSFLDNLTEELEERPANATEVYEDYKFLTRDAIVDLGLDHLIGSQLLRAHMHGYFVDVRLYKKALAVSASSQEGGLEKDRIRKEMEAGSRIEPKEKLPKVNKEVFLKLRETEHSGKKGKEAAALLEDDRFGAMFKDERFKVDKEEEAYKLLNPVISKMDEARMKRLKEQFEEVEQKAEESEKSEEDDIFSSDDTSDSEHSEEETKVVEKKKKSKVKMYELKEGFNSASRAKKNKIPLEQRIQDEQIGLGNTRGASAVHEMVFKRKKSKREIQEEFKNKKHLKERSEARRSTGKLKHKRKGFQ